jgi:hypothetical protein
METKFRLGRPAMTTDFTSNRARFLSEYRNDGRRCLAAIGARLHSRFKKGQSGNPRGASRPRATLRLLIFAMRAIAAWPGLSRPVLKLRKSKMRLSSTHGPLRPIARPAFRAVASRVRIGGPRARCESPAFWAGGGISHRPGCCRATPARRHRCGAGGYAGAAE